LTPPFPHPSAALVAGRLQRPQIERRASDSGGVVAYCLIWVNMVLSWCLASSRQARSLLIYLMLQAVKTSSLQTQAQFRNSRCELSTYSNLPNFCAEPLKIPGSQKVSHQGWKPWNLRRWRVQKACIVIFTDETLQRPRYLVCGVSTCNDDAHHLCDTSARFDTLWRPTSNSRLSPERD
jgi:hypothetical protein